MTRAALTGRVASELSRPLHEDRSPSTVPPAAARRSGLTALDESVRVGGAGVQRVIVSRGSFDAVARHVERRAQAAGRPVVSVVGVACDDPWRELARSVGAFVADPPRLVDTLIASAPSAVYVVPAATTLWGRELERTFAARLEREASDVLLLLLDEAEAERDESAARAVARASASSAPPIEIDGALCERDLRLWWSAAAEQAERVFGARELGDLEALWSTVLAAPRRSAAPPPPSSPLLRRLSLAQRGWPLAELHRLGPADELPALVASGAVGLVGRAPNERVAARLTVSPEPGDAAVVARELEPVFPTDPWAFARAGELLASEGDLDGAERATRKALASVLDPSARADFWTRWYAILEALPAQGAATRRIDAAELALRLGDVDRALDLARAAVGRLADEPAETFRALLTLGRATAARGDLTTGIVTLQRALDHAPDTSGRARVQAEIAEIRYLAGAHDDARALAEQALAIGGATDATTRLLARNVLGKLHLAAARWRDAEEHFAADACDASCAGDVVSELRARLNRAIAQISCGRHEEARAILCEVLDDGERLGELRAVAFAVANLAVIATTKHEYVEAMRLWERAIEARRRVGEKVLLVRSIVNLSELRLRLGLVDEAEQALAFGRMTCGPGLPPARSGDFSRIAARIHLARGRTLQAEAEARSALAAAAGSSDGAMLGDCYRTLARIALEDGDLGRADATLAQAECAASATRGEAENAILAGWRARAAGEGFDEQAQRALELARKAGDDELVLEAHLLQHHACVHGDDARLARAHLDAAVAIRNRIAASLPEDIRARFVARRDLSELARLEAEAKAETAAARSDSERPTAPPARAARPARIVGSDPAIVALGQAIQKVGASDATVLIHGESGTGKELVAEALHEASGRRTGPLVKVNCAALVETLLLSELFGHEKGSFTGAAGRKRGRFEMAEGGTLFLDEIGDISPRTQVALLRVLQDKTFERVGGVTPIRVNVRIVCATHRDLKAMVARGEFREDLYYRLRGVVLEVPALRKRLGDLPAIADAILARVADERRAPRQRLGEAALRLLKRHAWPGNVRELDNALRAAALFAEGEVIEADDLLHNVDGLKHLTVEAAVETGSASRPWSDDAPPTMGSVALGAGMAPASALRRGPEPVLATSETARPSADPTEVAYDSIRGGVSLHDLKRRIEEECIARALAESKGNITKAAALLGMKRPRLSQLVKQYGLGSGASESEES